MRPKCSQCNTLAVLKMKGIYLCIDCFSKLQEANYLTHIQLASICNQLLDDMDDIAGLPRTGGRYQIPTRTTIKAGQTTFNNIRVNDSIVGTINTGNVQKLDSRVSAMRGENKQELANAIQQLTQAILNTPDLQPSDKDSALECLSFLSDQALTPETERQSTIGRTIVSTLEKILANTGSIASIWSVVKPLFDSLFG